MDAHAIGADSTAPFVVTLDIGSSSVRARLYDRHGRVANGVSVQQQYTLRSDADGRAEMDAEVIFQRIAECMDALLEAAQPLAAQIAGVAVATLVSTLMAIDGDGQPLTPLITYADTRSAADARTLRDALDEVEIHQRTGTLLRPGYWHATLAWMHRTQPEIWNTASKWITLGEYLELRLFGRCRVSFSIASWGGLLNRHTLSWDSALLETIRVRETQLSPLVDLEEPIQGLIAPFAARWRALENVPWFPAVGDGVAANVGSGCTRHERVALTVGTSGAMRVIGENVERIPRGLWCYRVDRANALLGGATNEGGNLYKWLRDSLRLSEPDSLEAALVEAQPAAHGLTILPFIAGERSPGWSGDSQMTIHGITVKTSAVEIARATLEAVAYRYAEIHQRLCDMPGCQHELVASGSALLRSPAWMQIFADVLGKPVVASAVAEATSRGAALLALHALGLLPSYEAAERIDGKRYIPNSAHHQRYQEAIAHQRWLYSRVIGESHLP